MLSCDLMFLQSLKVINAGAASQGLREGEQTALSTSLLLQQQLRGPPRAHWSSLCAGAAALSALWEEKKERGRGLTEQDFSNRTSQERGVSQPSSAPFLASRWKL